MSEKIMFRKIRGRIVPIKKKGLTSKDIKMNRRISTAGAVSFLAATGGLSAYSLFKHKSKLEAINAVKYAGKAVLKPKRFPGRKLLADKAVKLAKKSMQSFRISKRSLVVGAIGLGGYVAAMASIKRAKK